MDLVLLSRRFCRPCNESFEDIEVGHSGCKSNDAVIAFGSTTSLDRQRQNHRTSFGTIRINSVEFARIHETHDP